eukprot:g12003.t1
MSQEVSYSPQYSQLLTYSCSHCVYVVRPVEFLINGNLQDIDSGRFSDGNTIKCQGAVDRLSLIGDGHSLAFVYCGCHLPLISPSLDIVQILLRVNMDSF